MGSNKTMTVEELEEQMNDFMSSGLTMKEYADKEGLNYSTFKSRVQTWKAKQGIPLERRGFIRRTNPTPRIEQEEKPMKEEKDQGMEQAIPQTTVSKKPSISKKGSPVPKKWFEGEFKRFGIQMTNDDFYLLQSFSSLSGMSMQEVTIQALKEYFAKPTRKELVNQAEAYSKIIKYNLNKK